MVDLRWRFLPSPLLTTSFYGVKTKCRVERKEEWTRLPIPWRVVWISRRGVGRSVIVRNTTFVGLTFVLRSSRKVWWFRRNRRKWVFGMSLILLSRLLSIYVVVRRW